MAKGIKFGRPSKLTPRGDHITGDHGLPVAVGTPRRFIAGRACAAAKQFNDAQAKLTQTRDQAVQTAKNTADASAAAASKTAFAGFGVLLLGLIAAVIGGSLAVQRPLLVTHRTVDDRAVRT
jgi:hypothetical protein